MMTLMEMQGKKVRIEIIKYVVYDGHLSMLIHLNNRMYYSRRFSEHI